MKTIIALLAIFFSSFTNAQTENPGTIKAVVPNVNSLEGTVLFGLYNEENFMVSAPVYSEAISASGDTAEVTFENVPEGTYALLVLHDKNNNQRMDYNSNGMPLESYGTSGTTSYGPPNWTDSKFEFDGGDRTIVIRF